MTRQTRKLAPGRVRPIGGPGGSRYLRTAASRRRTRRGRARGTRNVAANLRPPDCRCDRRSTPARTSFWRNSYVKTIIDCSASSSLCLRNRQRAATLTNSSTHTNSTRQRHHERPDLGLASEPAGGVGVRSQWHVHRDDRRRTDVERQCSARCRNAAIPGCAGVQR